MGVDRRRLLADLLWQKATADTTFHPGMAVKTKTGNIHIVGDLLGTGKGSVEDNGCGCCVSTYKVKNPKAPPNSFGVKEKVLPNWEIIEWAWLK
jgi:hypothetical protein